uniref:Uncharacterized protein n=1 Tax=Sphaerodactylus townsendi TaxID=933632 RepID=A0ACB8EHY3_9SAUR
MSLPPLPALFSTEPRRACLFGVAEWTLGELSVGRHVFDGMAQRGRSSAHAWWAGCEQARRDGALIQGREAVADGLLPLGRSSQRQLGAHGGVQLSKPSKHPDDKRISAVDCPFAHFFSTCHKVGINMDIANSLIRHQMDCSRSLAPKAAVARVLSSQPTGVWIGSGWLVCLIDPEEVEPRWELHPRPLKRATTRTRLRLQTTQAGGQRWKSLAFHVYAWPHLLCNSVLFIVPAVRRYRSLAGGPQCAVLGWSLRSEVHEVVFPTPLVAGFRPSIWLP